MHPAMIAVKAAAAALQCLVPRRLPQMLALFLSAVIAVVVVGTPRPPPAAFTVHRASPYSCQRRQQPNGRAAVIYYCNQPQRHQQQQRRFISLVVLASASSSSSSTPSIHNPYDPRQSDDNCQIRFGGIGRLYASVSNNNSNNNQKHAQQNETTKQDNPTTAPTTTTERVLERLRQATVVVVGLGGVGSWAAEAVARSGIGTVVLIDLDDVCVSNTNRQLPALQSTVGQFKVRVLQQRLTDLGVPRVLAIPDFVSSENVHAIFNDIERQLHGKNHTITAVIDAIDGAADKAALLAACRDAGIPIVVSCGAAAGLRDPQQVRIQDLTRVENDPLLAATKKYLRKHYHFPPGLPFRERQKGRKVSMWYMDGVYSDELVRNRQQQQQQQQQQKSSLRQCDGALGTACFVTGTFGFLAASVVVERIAQTDSTLLLRGTLHQRRKKSTATTTTPTTDRRPGVPATSNSIQADPASHRTPS